MGARPRGDRGARQSEPHERRTAHRVVAASLVLGLLGGAAGAWWGGHRAEVRQATAVILLNPLQGNPFSPDARGDDLVNLETEAQLVTSDAVLDQLGSALPGRPVVDADQVSVVLPANTQLLSISVTAATAEEAEAATQELAVLYLAFRRARTQSALSNQRANIDLQIEQRVRERAALVARLDDLRPGASDTLLSQQIVAVITEISELRTQLGEVGSVSLDPGQVVTPARASSAGLVPSGPWVPAGVGLLLGALCGAVLVTQLRPRNQLVRTRADLADLDVPCWGTLAPDRDPAATARLRAALLAPHRDPRTVVLVCRAGSHGVPTTAESLAASLAAARLRTVLVDVAGSGARDRDRDRRPARSQHRDPATGPGLTEVLCDRATLEASLTWTGDLARLGTGHDSDGLDDLAATPEMDVVILELRDLAHVVLLQAGSPTSPRTQALVAAADVVLLEVPVGAVSATTVEREVAELATAGAGRVGLVLVAAPVQRHPDREDEPERGAGGLRQAAASFAPVPRTRDALILVSRRLARVGLHGAAGSTGRTRGPA